MKKVANLLWTSSWEPAYRFLELLLVQERAVQACVVCTSGIGTMEHGMHWRIPVSGRNRNFAWFTVKPPVKKYQAAPSTDGRPNNLKIYNYFCC